MKLLSALGAAALCAAACNSPGSSSPAGQMREHEAAGTEVTTAGTTPGLFLRVDVFPYALVNDTFPVIVSIRNSAGQLMNVAGNITISLSTNPTAATLLGSAIKAPTNGVARFDVSIAKPGQGYVIKASQGPAGTATSALFNVDYSQNGVPGTTTSTAAVISPKVPLFASMAPGDVHYYKFSATAGQHLTVSSYANRLDNPNWDTSLRVRLLAPDGTTEIARAAGINGDGPGVDNGLLLVRLPQDGDYYLVCDADNSGFQAGTYALLTTLVVDPGISLQKETEAWGATGVNDTIATAQKLSAGTMYGHYDSTATGGATSDFYAITIVNPVRVRVDLNAARSGAPYGDRPWVGRLELQDSTGAVLWGNDRSYGLDPAIDYVITKAGTYYVRVTTSNVQPNAYSSPYFLNYASTPYTAVAETATNTTTAGATTVAYNSDVTGTFAGPGTHWFAFGGTAGDVVRLIVQDRTVLQGATLGLPPPAQAPAPVAPTSDMSFVQADGVTVLPAATSPMDATKSLLNYRQTILPSTATYFVRVQSNTAGKFGLRLEKVTATGREVEPNDTAATATVMPASNWVSGTIGTTGEQDHFRVHADAAGQLVTVSVLAANGAGLGSFLSDWGSSLIPSIEIRDAAGNLLSATSADRKGATNFAETLQHPLVAQISNVPPTVQTSFRAPAAADFDVMVTDADGQGGANYFYALQVGKNQ
jgi:Bacterial pre-peptidase C-terminal domain